MPTIVRIVKSRRIHLARNVVSLGGDITNAHGIFMGKLLEKCSLGRLTGRWEDEITMDFRQVGGSGCPKGGLCY